MQFKHPEFLYALLALLIPIIVHLFQLRRFQKVYFSNVEFLKTITTQTRKSSQLKKWLTLLTRMLMFGCIIIAFTEPYFAANTTIDQKSNTVIYLDNSFSMQAKGPRGPLLQRAVQELITALPKDEKVSIFTNTDTYTGVTIQGVQNDLLQLEYSPNQLPYETAFLKAKQLLPKVPDDQKRVIMISDFQQKENAFSLPKTDSTTTVNLVQLSPVTSKNIAIDSLAVQRNENNELAIWVQLKNSGDTEKSVPVACYNKDILIGKTTVTIAPYTTSNTVFKIDEAVTIQGRVVIEDPNLSFDNVHYFSLNAPDKIKVVAISEVDDAFIHRIYTPDEFIVSSNTLRTLNYNDINTANLVILNEIKHLPVSLLNTLKNYSSQGGTICFIPSTEGDLASYNTLLSDPNSLLTAQKKQERKITAIHFSNPVFKGVFESTVQNFQYPKVDTYYPITNAQTPILAFENETPFLYKTNTTYVFTAAINTTNSNFQNSPLIVPTLYNIGKQSLQFPDISYTIGQTNTFDVTTVLGQDGILSLHSDKESCIPLQQSYTSKVKITTENTPTKAGIYTVQNKEKVLHYVSYNYTSKESNTLYYDLSTYRDHEVTQSIDSLFRKLKELNSVHEIWKWFVTFALLFLGIELLLLNYLK